MNILYIVKKVLLQFLRDKRLMFLIIFVPLFIMSIFYFLFIDGLINEVRLGIYYPDKDSKVAKGIMDFLNERDEINHITLSDDNLSSQIEKKNLDAAILFKEDFNKIIKEDKKAFYEVVYEGTAPDIAKIVERIMEGALMNGYKESKGTFVRFMGAELDIEMEESYKYASEDFRFIDLISPAFIVFFVYFISFLLTCVAFLRERSYGTLDRIFVSPIKTFELILGYMLAFFILSLIQSTILLLYMKLALGIRTEVNIFLALVPIMITVLLGVTMGIFFSTFAKTEFQVIQFIPIVIIPQSLLSGVLFEVEAIPEGFRQVSYALPLTYTNFILKDVLLRGKSFTELWLDFLILIGFFALFLFLSFIAIRRLTLPRNLLMGFLGFKQNELG